MRSMTAGARRQVRWARTNTAFVPAASPDPTGWRTLVSLYRARYVWTCSLSPISGDWASPEMGVSTTTVRKLLKNRRCGLPDSVTVRHAMVERLGTEHGAAAYTKRKTAVETVFGNIKANPGFRRFSHRGLDATSSEWDSSAPSSSCSRSTGTDSQPPRSRTRIDAPPPRHVGTPARRPSMRQPPARRIPVARPEGTRRTLRVRPPTF